MQENHQANLEKKGLHEEIGLQDKCNNFLQRSNRSFSAVRDEGYMQSD